MDNVDYLKKPPWKKIFFDIFAIHLTSTYEKWCRMLQRLFSLFQGSKNQLCFWHDALRASKCFFLSTQLKGLQNTARARRIHSFFICNQCSKLKDWRSVQILIHKENKNRNIEVVICQVADTLEIGSDWHVDTFWVILVSPLLLLLTYLVTYSR